MRRTTRALAVVAATAALALAGCSDSGGNSGSSGGNGEVAQPDDAPTLSDINPVDRDKLQQGGKLRFAITQLPVQWNYLEAAGAAVDLNTILGFVAPSNWDYAEDASTTPNENFVKEVKVEDGPPQVVHIKLNPDAKWNNGTPITWKDYEATWKACNGENEDYQCASTDGFNQVDKVEAGEDDFDVVITYKSTYPDWTGTWSGVFNAESLADAETFNTGQLDGPNNDWLAGPFKIDSVDEAQKVVKLVPNDNWWGDKPLLDEVTFRELDADLAPQSFANSEIDVLQYLISADQYNRVQSRPDGEIRSAGGQQWRHFTFNGNAKNLEDKKVRQAIIRGLDREAIAESDLAGLPIEASELMLGNHFLMPGQQGYQDNAQDLSYDPEAAGELLDEAGWTLEDGQQFRTKDGEELEVDYAMLAGVPTSENEGKLLQADMEKIGVKVNLVNKSSDDFSPTLIDGTFGIIAFTWQSTVYPFANIGQIYTCDAENNFSNICNEEIDKLTAEADVEMDEDKRSELGNQIDKLVWDEVMNAPLYRRMEYTAVPQNLANFGAFGLSTGRAENIGFTE